MEFEGDKEAVMIYRSDESIHDVQFDTYGAAHFVCVAVFLVS